LSAQGIKQRVGAVAGTVAHAARSALGTSPEQKLRAAVQQLASAEQARAVAQEKVDRFNLIATELERYQAQYDSVLGKARRLVKQFCGC